MRVPNKLFTYEQSTLSIIPSVLDTLCSTENNQMKVSELYMETRKLFVKPQDFIEVMDALYYLGKIELIQCGPSKEVAFVKRD